MDSLPPQITSSPADVKRKNIPPITLAWLGDTLRKARPDKAGGGDRTNLYILHLLLLSCKEALVSLTKRLMLHGLPQHWAHANLAMLHKKGDPHSALNYRPIFLLNCCYKLIAKWLLAELDGLTTKYQLVNLSKMGGLKCRRTADHIFRVLQALQVHPNPYHLYIDFEKKHSTAWSALRCGACLNTTTCLMS